MTLTATTTTKPSAPRWMAIALFASLALNLVVVGVAAGLMWRHGGRVVVVTGKFTPNARLHVDHVGFDVDHLEGQVWGVGKADVLRREGASIYVGDHFHDVEGALAAGALSVSVLTGGCTREELYDAGTHVVLDDLGEFPGWLDGHLGQLGDGSGGGRTPQL